MNLTDKQKGVLMYMQNNAKMKLSYPTVRQVAKYFGISPTAAHEHIVALRRKGALTESTNDQAR